MVFLSGSYCETFCRRMYCFFPGFSIYVAGMYAAPIPLRDDVTCAPDIGSQLVIVTLCCAQFHGTLLRLLPLFVPASRVRPAYVPRTFRVRPACVPLPWRCHPARRAAGVGPAGRARPRVRGKGGGERADGGALHVHGEVRESR